MLGLFWHYIRSLLTLYLVNLFEGRITYRVASLTEVPYLYQTIAPSCVCVCVCVYFYQTIAPSYVCVCVSVCVCVCMCVCVCVHIYIALAFALALALALSCSLVPPPLSFSPSHPPISLPLSLSRALSLSPSRSLALSLARAVSLSLSLSLSPWIERVDRPYIDLLFTAIWYMRRRRRIHVIWGYMSNALSYRSTVYSCMIQKKMVYSYIYDDMKKQDHIDLMMIWKRSKKIMPYFFISSYLFFS